MKTLILFILLFPNIVMASEGICVDTDISTIIVIVGRIMNVLKIGVPILLIVFGMLDFLKATSSFEDKASSVAFKNFKSRLIAGAIVFLVPTIISLVVTTITNVGNMENKFVDCTDCLFNPSKCNDTVVLLKEQERIEEEKRKEQEENNNITSSADITFSYEFNTEESLRYALYTPSSAENNSKTPLIVWLHGSGEVNASESTFRDSGLLKIIDNWELEGFNAYVLCPISSGGWADQREELYELIAKIVKEKKINTDKIVLVGHSMGGTGVQLIADGNADYFSALVILSGYNAGVALNQFQNTPLRAYSGDATYGEDTASYNYTKDTLKHAFGENNVKILLTDHASVPSKAFNLDENNDNKSDLIEWMLKNRETVEDDDNGNKNPEYTSSNSHTNSINGVKYKIYEQRDPEWNDLSFPGSDGTGNVGDRGCNIITVGVIASAYDASITPYTVYYSGYKTAHPYDAVNKLTNNAFTCSMTTSATNSSIIESLKQGKVVVIVVYGKSKGGSSKFTSSQHYMALIDISSDGNKIFVGNSYENGTSTYGKSGWFSTSDVLTSVQQAHTCTPSQSLIDKFN